MPCRNLSDFVFLALQDKCGTKGLACIQRLKYVTHVAVCNPVGISVGQQVFTGKPHPPENYPPWPGRVYNTDIEAGAALVGILNGYGVAFMLAQHRQQFGPRLIDQVSIFGDDNGVISFAWHISLH